MARDLSEDIRISEAAILINIFNEGVMDLIKSSKLNH